MNKSMTSWGITDGHAGMLSQVTGLAEAIGLPTEIKTCKRRAPWVWLPAMFPIVNPLNHLTNDSDSLNPPWPDLLITCGRRQLPYALWIRKHSEGKTFCAHIQNPRIPLDKLDLIIAPEHDGISGDNVISTKGAIHKITPQKLIEGGKSWQTYFADYPRPYHVVLLGGSTNRYEMTSQVIEKLAEQIKSIADNNAGSVLITPSYRTPHLDLLQSHLEGNPRIFLADLTKENPYLGMLGLADYLYVTNDSVNMMCEANMTGKPLYLLVPQGHQDTVPSRFSDTLVEEGIARIYQGKTEDWTYTPFDETEKAAKEIRKRLGL